MSTEIRKGSQVRVVGARGKGEKAPKGTVGTCFWIGEHAFTLYGRTTYTQRIGFKTSEGKTYFTAASNLALVA